MDWLASTVIVLGLGACDNSADWCSEPVGKAAIEQSIVEQKRNSIWLNIEHFSDVDDRDYGANIFMLEYRYRIR